MEEWSIRKWALKGSNDNIITQKKSRERRPNQLHTQQNL